tara:strand:+ start:72 stop:299 length:228 start_codon:yes stop_codon:yes gene_type:complete
MTAMADMARPVETWAEIKDRHAIERAEAVMALCGAGMIQADAARALDMTLQALNAYLIRNGLVWTASKRGNRKQV